MDELHIAAATSADAADIAAIYAPYVRDTAITFEYEAPSAQEMSSRIKRVTATHPWLIARNSKGVALGYAYASPYYGRAAYAWCAETSIYVASRERGHSIGSTLYKELERTLSAQGVLNLYACIATTRTPDSHLDNASVDFHTRRGYHEIGRFPNCGYKFGRWYDTVWMERDLGEHRANQPPVRTFSQVKATLGL
ncbi:MAG: GNAT family N-acetyltransferase [Olsenella sp.]|jgi:phosphinothricin acetyltransferase|nr:GNAT family N-acetyltransferase [Olsenella sp.]MCI2156398.1 GNAT family N-acetyltransferase [Olsenella sp.]